MNEQFTDRDYTELSHLFGGGDITKASKANLERYLAMLSRPNAHTHFGQSSFNQICETVRTLFLARASEQSNAISAQKELEQDFRILLSREQGKLDFIEWSTNLSGEAGQIAVLFIDIDNFKAINTRHTHTRVDASFLPDTMRLLEGVTRLRGGAYRYGGDEYLVILPNVELSEALHFAEKVRTAYENHVFQIEGDQIFVTVSIGLAIWPSHGSTYAAVLESANSAEAQAKANKNCVIVAGNQSATIIPQSGLSLPAQKLAAHLCLRSQFGLEHDPVEDAEPLGESLQLSQETLGAAASQLEERGWISFRRTLGMGKSGFSSLWATSQLFIECDPVLKAWVPKNDAKAVGNTLLEMSDESSTLANLDAHLKWGPRRLNSAVAYLVKSDFVLSSKTMNADPYVSNWIKAKPKLRLLLDALKG